MLLTHFSKISLHTKKIDMVVFVKKVADFTTISLFIYSLHAFHLYNKNQLMSFKHKLL